VEPGRSRPRDAFECPVHGSVAKLPHGLGL